MYSFTRVALIIVNWINIKREKLHVVRYYEMYRTQITMFVGKIIQSKHK